MGDGDLSPANRFPSVQPAAARAASGVGFGVRLALTLSVLAALLVSVTGCAEDSESSIAPLAGAPTTTSTTAAPGATTAAATPTSKGSAAPASTAVPTETTVTPTSAPSAKRFADGTVVSAGGYEAKTPAVARGLLLEPKWTDEQQEAADVIHKYLDAMITTVTDKKPDKKIPTSMTDLERPDLNAGGFVQLDTQNLVRGMTKTGGYWVDPESSQSAYWVSDLDQLAGGRLQIGMCEYNGFERRGLKDDRVIDDKAGSAYWDGQIAPTKPGWRIVTLLHQGTERGRAGCAAS